MPDSGHRVEDEPSPPMKLQSALTIILSVTALLFSGCTATPSSPQTVADSANSPAPLGSDWNTIRVADAVTTQTWVLTRAQSQGRDFNLPTGSTFTLKLDRDGEVTGRAGVNAYYGTAALNTAGNLQWHTELAFTAMDVSSEILASQKQYLSTLRRTNQVSFSGDQMIFRGAGSEMVFVKKQDSLAPAYVAR